MAFENVRRSGDDGDDESDAAPANPPKSAAMLLSREIVSPVTPARTCTSLLGSASIVRLPRRKNAATRICESGIGPVQGKTSVRTTFEPTRPRNCAASDAMVVSRTGFPRRKDRSNPSDRVGRRGCVN